MISDEAVALLDAVTRLTSAYDHLKFQNTVAEAHVDDHRSERRDGGAGAKIRKRLQP